MSAMLVSLWILVVALIVLALWTHDKLDDLMHAVGGAQEEAAQERASRATDLALADMKVRVLEGRVADLTRQVDALAGRNP